MLSLDEETKSDDMGLRPQKRRNTASMLKLLGGIGDVLGDGFATPGRKEIVVVPSSLETSPSSFIDSLTADRGACSVLGGALGVSRGFPSSDTPYMVEKLRTASHPLASKAYIPGWAVTKDSLLSEDITAQECSYCAHPPATIKLLAAQSGARMAENLWYAAAQASALMVVVADRVCRPGINKTQLKTSQDVVASLRVEHLDSEAERRRLSEQY